VGDGVAEGEWITEGEGTVAEGELAVPLIPVAEGRSGNMGFSATSAKLGRYVI
jgi:hypothetical protein